MAQSPLAFVPGVGDTYFGNSRLFSDSPHTDGLLYAGTDWLETDSANLVKTRNGNGDWSLNRTAVGAETYHIRFTLDQIFRIGELIQTGNFGSLATQSGSLTPTRRGIGVLDFFADFKVGVVALTSATLRLGKTVYSAAAAGAAPTQTDIVAATALSAATAANYKLQTVAVPVGSQQFFVDDISTAEIELTVVMANTGTIGIAGLGCHLAYNY